MSSPWSSNPGNLGRQGVRKGGMEKTEADLCPEVSFTARSLLKLELLSLSGAETGL